MFKNEWLKKYNYAKKYYEKHGNLLISQDYVVIEETGNIIKLGRWINSQRTAYKNGKLNKKQIELLNEIEMVWKVNGNNEVIKNDWIRNYNLAKKYYEEHGSLLIPQNYVVIEETGNIIKLGMWINNQRVAYKNEKLNKRQIELLNEIKMVWKVNCNYNQELISDKWIRNYNFAKKYYEKHGNLLIPQNYVVKDKNESIIKLGLWINRQRTVYKNGKLNRKQIELLNKIKMVWKVNCNYNQELIADKWIRNYNLAQKYYEEHSNLLIPQNYVVKDENGSIIKLGLWINSQREAYKNKKLNKKQIELLNEIEMVWKVNGNNDVIKNDWIRNYNLAQKYYEEHSNLLIPRDYVVIEETGNIIKLGRWINSQRTAYKNGKLNKKQIELLNEIEMVWKVNGNNEVIKNDWIRNYNLAKKYYEEHGSLLIPQNYVVIEETGNIIKLGMWINNQRVAYKNEKLNKRQIELLNEIKMVWKVNCNYNHKLISDKWIRNYNFAKEYYEEHNNLLIPRDYVVIEETGNIIKLGRWINSQRTAYKNGKLNKKQIELLNEIEMVWKVNGNNEVIKNDWIRNYNLAKKYYEEHGSLLIPQNYVVIEETGNIIKLGMWINNQRVAYKNEKLNKRQIELLNEIKMVWKVNCNYNHKLISDKWIRNYNFAKEYYEEHNNLLIPRDYVVIEETGNIIKLGLWINKQRQTYKNEKLNKRQIELLNEIKMVWKVNCNYNHKLISDKWIRNYNFAKEYYEEHNNLLIPRDYVVIEETGNIIKLGRWINIQRQVYKNGKLNRKQTELLNKIKMVWKVNSNYSQELIKDKWVRNYNLAKEYYEEHSNLLIPQDYVVIEETGNIIKLGLWMNSQRQAYKNGKLNEKQIELLNEIKMAWKVNGNNEVIKNDWIINYNLAKKYYEKHGNLLISQDYVVIEETGNIIKLGFWINRQRIAYKNGKLNKNQIELLNEIKMAWKVNGNNEVIKNDWIINYNLAKKYYEKHGNLLISQDYVVIEETGNIIKLGFWINRQRIAYRNEKLNEKQIELLNSIDMIYDVKYYKALLNDINMQYYMFLYGLLDSKNVDELIKNGKFTYNDQHEIVKANALVLSRKK